MAEAKRLMDEVFVGEDRERLAALRTEDPQKNLTERWKKVAEERPSIAERRLAYVPEIVSQGWAVVAIPDEDFAYTIGLKYRYDQPELLIAAKGLKPKDLGRLLNVIGGYVAMGNRIGPDEPVELTDFELTLVFQPYSQEVFERFATGYLSTFERYFEDRFHEVGDTLPVLWAELVRKKKAKKKPKKEKLKKDKPKKEKPKKDKPKKDKPKKADAKKKGAKAEAAKKPAKKAAAKKPVAKKPAKKTAKKTAAKKTAVKKQPAKKKAAPKKKAR